MRLYSWILFFLLVSRQDMLKQRRHVSVVQIDSLGGFPSFITNLSYCANKTKSN